MSKNIEKTKENEVFSLVVPIKLYERIRKFMFVNGFTTMAEACRTLLEDGLKK